MRKIISCAVVLILVSGVGFAEDIQLPDPDKKGGMSLMEALDARESNRKFSDKELKPQTLSNLLWAAFGTSHNGRRTAPSAYNSQEVDLYVVLSSGVYVYQAESNLLSQVSATDIRSKVGGPKEAAHAPVQLVYVADYDRMTADKDFYSATDTGFISQNVYLYCASEGLNTVVIGGVNKDAIRPVLKLRESQHIILSQPVGYAP